MRSRRILLLGYHGERNIGDDAICISLAKTLGVLFGQEMLLYIYTKEEYIKQNFGEDGLRISFTSSFLGVLKALINSQVVVVDGGDHLHDYGTLSKALKIFMAFFMLAIFTKVSFKKFVIINGGFRVSRGISLSFLKMILSITCCVSVRDRASFDLISKYVHRQPVMGFDTSMLLDYHCPPVISADHKNVGFSITPVFSNFFLNPEKDELMAKAIAHDINDVLHSYRDVCFCFLAFNTNSKVGDVTLIERIMQMLDFEVLGRVKLIGYSGNIYDFLLEMSRMDAVVCCKYHSLVFSYLLRKPMLVIDYHPKNSALIPEIGLSSKALLSLDDILSGKLSGMLFELLKNPEEFQARLSRHEAKQRALNGIQKCIIRATKRGSKCSGV